MSLGGASGDICPANLIFGIGHVPSSASGYIIDRPGDVRRLTRAKPQYEIRYFFRFADPSQDGAGLRDLDRSLKTDIAVEDIRAC